MNQVLAMKHASVDQAHATLYRSTRQKAQHEKELVEVMARHCQTSAGTSKCQAELNKACAAKQAAHATFNGMKAEQGVGDASLRKKQNFSMRCAQHALLKFEDCTNTPAVKCRFEVSVFPVLHCLRLNSWVRDAAKSLLETADTRFDKNMLDQLRLRHDAKLNEVDQKLASCQLRQL